MLIQTADVIFAVVEDLLLLKLLVLLSCPALGTLPRLKLQKVIFIEFMTAQYDKIMIKENK